MSIYSDVKQIDDYLTALQEKVECTEDDAEREEILRETRNFIISQGLESLCKVRQNKIAEIASFKDEEDRIKARRKTQENALQSLENYISLILQESGEEKKVAGTFTVSFRKSQKCIIDENVFNDERFQRIEEVRTIDKMGVKKALNAGETIPGAFLEENKNLNIR